MFLFDLAAGCIVFETAISTGFQSTHAKCETVSEQPCILQLADTKSINNNKACSHQRSTLCTGVQGKRALGSRGWKKAIISLGICCNLTKNTYTRINFQGEKHANLELDASLVEDLETVGLVTDCGTVKVKDLTSYQIRLASAANDITCQGILDGNIMAELGNDGNFFAHSLEGPSATVTTESGDIVVWNQCYSERSHFFTRSGNVSVRNLNNQSYISIKEAGDLEASLSYGSVSAVVRTGDIVMEIGKAYFSAPSPSFLSSNYLHWEHTWSSKHFQNLILEKKNRKVNGL